MAYNRQTHLVGSPVEAYREKLLPERQRAEVRNAWLAERLDTFLPELMERVGIDLWIINTQESNEDPVLMSMMPQPAYSAWRRNMLVFSRCEDGSVERLDISRYGVGPIYERVWDPDAEGQYECLARLVRERDPKTIGINTSVDFAYGDGLTHIEYVDLAAALGDDLMSRCVSAEALALGWLEHRTDNELVVYPALVEMGHALIAEAYSTRVIQPGITTIHDVEWWLVQKMRDLNLNPWFPPTIDIQARGFGLSMDFSRKVARREVIMPGDVLHCDVGFSYLGLCTDQQQNAYVLLPGETDAPAGLKAALAQGNAMQDALLAAMRPGRSGNEVLADALATGDTQGLRGQVYTHPIGYHGHAAGPTIGMWDMQQGVPGRGDYRLYDHTAYSIELNVRATIPEWDDQEIRMALEEEAFLVDGAMRWPDGRQERWHLIG